MLVFGLISMVTVPRRNLEVPVLGDIGAMFPGLTEQQLLAAAAGIIVVFFLVRPGTHATAGLPHENSQRKESANSGRPWCSVAAFAKGESVVVAGEDFRPSGSGTTT